MERECLLAAFDVIDRHIASGLKPQSVAVVGSLVSALGAPPIPRTGPAETVALPAPAPAALPAKAVEKPYLHPELATLGGSFGDNGKIVSWAIQQMTEDYTVRDIAALLAREGSSMSSAKLSVVLSRLKNRGEIEQITPGRGRRPGIFRNPARVVAAEISPAV